MHADHAELVRLYQSCLEVAYCIFILIFRTEAGSLLGLVLARRASSPLAARTKQTASRSTGASPLAGSMSPTSTPMPQQVVFGGPPLRRSPPLAGRQDRSPSLRRSKRTGTAKETTGGKAPRQQRAEEKQVTTRRVVFARETAGDGLLCTYHGGQKLTAVLGAWAVLGGMKSGWEQFGAV